MCNCIHHWTDDPAVAGVHNRVPVSCAEYIARLEARLRSQGAPIVLELGRIEKPEDKLAFDQWLERVRATLDPV